jgi:ATP/maltotriose-dependent transcriptional regulator MalT
VKISFVQGVEAALTLGRLDQAEALVSRIEALRPGELVPFLRAQATRFRARLAAARDEHGAVEQGFKTAAATLREYGIPFWLAVTQLEHSEWLAGQGRRDEAEALVAEARETFARLEAAPWLERVAHLGVEVAA